MIKIKDVLNLIEWNNENLIINILFNDNITFTCPLRQKQK